MHYPSEMDLFENVEPEPENQSDWQQSGEPFASVETKFDNFKVAFDGIDLHPMATHLLFFDTVGHMRDEHTTARGKDCIPQDHIHALKRALASEGVSEGMILMNGGTDHVEHAKFHIGQLNPVIAFKSIGGASELVARMIEIHAQIKDHARYEEELRQEREDVQKAEDELS
eukprot:COSAG02_NODE_29627_length_566_cov_0.492505_1_plen_170_part_10